MDANPQCKQDLNLEYSGIHFCIVSVVQSQQGLKPVGLNDADYLVYLYEPRYFRSDKTRRDEILLRI